MRKKIILAVLLLAAVAAVTGAVTLSTGTRTPVEPQPPPAEVTRICLEAAESQGLPSAKLALIVKAQAGNIANSEAIRLREALRRQEIPQCARLYDYLARR